MIDASKAIWHKSTFSGLNGCVEIAVLHERIAVRDSKDRNGPILLFTYEEWNVFLNSVKRGQFGQHLTSHADATVGGLKWPNVG